MIALQLLGWYCALDFPQGEEGHSFFTAGLEGLTPLREFGFLQLDRYEYTYIYIYVYLLYTSIDIDETIDIDVYIYIEYIPVFYIGIH